MNSNLRDCRDYFRANTAFRRPMIGIRKKWESLGRVGGKVTIADASQEERQALGSLFGRQFSQQTITFAVSEFEKALQKTKYGDVTLHPLLEAYFEEDLVPNQTLRETRKAEKDQFWDRMKLAFSENPQSTAYRWVCRMEQDRDYGYCLIGKGVSWADAEKSLQAVGNCLQEIDTLSGGREPWIYLAVLSAKATGNPHFLDRGSRGGNLLLYALAFRSKCEYPKNARDVLSLYEQNGVLPDDISSSVAAFGIHLCSNRGLHPGFEGFLKERQSCVITLGNLAEIQKAYGQNQTIFVVENEMVFSHLVNQLKDLPVSLICTSGQPKAAALILLDLLSKQNCGIRYAGDLDPEGVCIADRLWNRYPNQLTLWRMSEADYEISCSYEELNESRLAKMEALTNETLIRTAQRIQACRMAGYQENLLAEMEQDIRHSCMV